MASINIGATRITSTGKIIPLDLKAEPDDIIHPDDASDPKRLARLLTSLLATVNTLRRRFAAPRIDFEDRVCGTSGALLSLPHRMNGRVRWYVVDWAATTPGASAVPVLTKDASSTVNTLVLASYVAGTATIRVEQAG